MDGPVEPAGRARNLGRASVRRASSYRTRRASAAGVRVAGRIRVATPGRRRCRDGRRRPPAAESAQTARDHGRQGRGAGVPRAARKR